VANRLVGADVGVMVLAVQERLGSETDRFDRDPPLKEGAAFDRIAETPAKASLML